MFIVKPLSPSRAWCVVLIVMGGTILSGWFKGQASSPEVPAPTIRVSTHLVLVDVVATNKEGKPVLGLQPEDFVVEENGRVQKISTFGTPAENAPAQPELPPGIYSNRAQYRSPGGPIIVLLLDTLNTPFQAQAHARQQMLRFVEEQYKPGQRVAIFTLTGSLGMLQDFTSDPEILRAALRAYKPQAQEFADASRPSTSILTGTPNIATSVTAMDASAAPVSGGATGAGREGNQLIASAQAALQTFAGAQVAYAEDQRAVITLNALNSLGRILGGLPGRKSLIWVTSVLPFSLTPENRNVSEMELAEDLPSLDTRRVREHGAGSSAAFFRQSHSKEIRELAARLSNAQVAIYPVDAQGLSISTDIDDQETMREMARETGGRAYVNQNEIRVGVERAFEDSSATYSLGYYPADKKWNGEYRLIKVKIKRTEAEIRSRRGYYALDPTQTKGYNPNQEVAFALGDVAPSTVVAFTAQIKPPSENAAKGKIGVTFLVDASTLSVEDASGSKRFNIGFFATFYSHDSKLLSNLSQQVDRTFSPDMYKQILQNGVMLHMDLDPQPQGSQVRLAVQDNHTGLVGTIDVPAPAK